MIAKVIGHGDSRDAAYDRLIEALEATAILGPTTNLGFLHRLAADAKIKGDTLSTRYIEAHLAELTAQDTDPSTVGYGVLALLEAQQAAVVAARRAATDEPHSPWDRNDGFELAGLRSMSYAVEADGVAGTAAIDWTANGPLVSGQAGGQRPDVAVDGDQAIIWQGLRQTKVRLAARRRAGAKKIVGDVILAPMPGRLSRLFVQEGDRVARGDRVAVVEAMKMEHILHAEADGVVRRLGAAEGAQLDAGATIAEFDLMDQT
jgi:3-methylcrotonyl-CoA carboxylase alpha subunit